LRVPISWLREFVPALPSDTETIADRLAMLGFPVAQIERRPVIAGVVTGKVVTLEKHPNADRLSVARIDVGDKAPLTIATAATNVAVGQTIAVATVGAKLPALTIEARTMRGVASQGMMISADELALTPEWFEDGIMQLDSSIEPGIDVVDLFGLGADVLDVEITANRPDSMSILGLARELAASYGFSLELPSFVNPGQGNEPGGSPTVAIESSDCHRFVAQYFDGVRVGAAPAWMRIRLALAGQRPINNFVDVSNYVMLETGQPLHFYDAGHIANLRLIVRDAHDGERLVTLDGVERVLSPKALVIADEDAALGLAGVMGGLSSEVTSKTRAVVLESANFAGTRVRRMSATLGLRTDASSRHEKSLAPALSDMGAARAAQLLRDLGASAYHPRVFGAEPSRAPAIPLRVSEFERLVGFALPATRIAAHLAALGCEAAPQVNRSLSTSLETGYAEESNKLLVTPPPWRCDLTIPADLVEEVARIEGYDRIPAVLPSVAPHDISSAGFELENQLAEVLEGLGYWEIITHSLRARGDERAVAVRNPLSEEQRFLRNSLVPGLLDYLASAAIGMRIFEIGDSFESEASGIVESKSLAFGFSTNRSSEPAWRDPSFLRLKGDCEMLLQRVTGRSAGISPGMRSGFHPGKTGNVTVDGGEVGVVGCVDPRITKVRDLAGNAYLCVISIDALPPSKTARYRMPSRFPSTYRDLALVLDVSVSAGEIEECITGVLGALASHVAVFDEYRGPQVEPARKSLAVRITLRRFDATITDEEADAAISRVLDALRERFGATIRS
jgi:phenylalanyl-tRNA synthetase beta chain